MGDLLHVLGPDPAQAARAAVTGGSKRDIEAASRHLTGLMTIGPKIQAIHDQRPEALRWLLERDTTISEDLVAAACQRKDRKSIRMLIDFGWPVNQPVYHAGSLLWFATDDEDLMECLLDCGADINARSRLDEPVLARAISCGSIDVVNLLLARHADTSRGNLLHCAAERVDHEEGSVIARILIERGADVNAYRYNNPIALRLRGMSRLPTPLHVACYEQNVPVGKVLIKHGADPNLHMLEAGIPCPPTALEAARETNSQELIEMLLNDTLVS